LTTSLLTFISAAVAAPVFGIDPVLGALLAVVFCYGAEAILALAAGWPLSWRSPVAWLARDVLLPLLWACGWSGRNVVWRGNAMDVDDGVFLQAESEPRSQI
jgi:ceramide glucosyltransferase